MPFQAFAYRGRRVGVKGRTLEMAGRVERQGGGAASLTLRCREVETSTKPVRAIRHKNPQQREARTQQAEMCFVARGRWKRAAVGMWSA